MSAETVTAGVAAMADSMLDASLTTLDVSSNVTHNTDNFLHNPTYKDFAKQSANYFDRQIRTFPTTTLSGIVRDLKVLYNNFESIDLIVLICAILFCASLRHVLTEYLFKPICKWRQVPTADAEKVPESGWKFMFYLSTWTTITVFVFTMPGMNFLDNPASIWDGYSLKNAVEREIYWIYAFELGYYFHALYTTLVLDQRRKDTLVMMLHHLLTILLISISFCNRCHKSGLVALFLHDGCDIFLEGTKLLKYFKVQRGKVYHRIEPFVNAGFIAFLGSWIVNRLYLFPLKQIYYASLYVEHLKLDIPFCVLLNFMLWVLLILNVYWFTFALLLLFKVVTGQLKEIEDTREFDEQSALTSSTQSQSQDGECESSMIENKSQDRKLSCDSGVGPGNSESSECDDSSVSERTTPTPPPSPKSSSPIVGYNLRHRK